MKINFTTRKYVQLSMDEVDLDTKANLLLIERKHLIEMEFYELTEFEYWNGIRTNSVRVTITKQGFTDPVIDCIYNFHGNFPATVDHLVNERYLNPVNQYSQFLTVWSNRLNKYSEIFINDYEKREIIRFVT